MRKTIVKAACFAAWAAAPTVHVAAALAADASPWSGDRRSEIRLVAGRADGNLLQAGVEIRLAPNWKTYWRYPGDSGVPPSFDFTKSENVKAVQVAWPAPKRLVDTEGVTIGYKERVLFPLRVERNDASKPAVLRLKLDYAICEKLCIPVQAAAELAAAPSGGGFASLIAAFEQTVPKPRALGAEAALAVRAVHQHGTGKSARVEIDIAAPHGVTPDVFAEGPGTDWALPVPEPVAGAPAGLQRYAFALDGMPPGVSAKGAVIKITAVAGAEAIETVLHLD